MICAKQTQFPPAQRNRWGKPHLTHECNCVKQTQFGPAGRQAGVPGRRNRAKQSRSGCGSTRQRGPTAPNKANLGRVGCLRRDRMCGTKPIPARPEETVGQAPSYQCVQLRQTNPIQGGRQAGWVPGRRDRAKQSQFGQTGRWAGASEDERAKQSQFPLIRLARWTRNPPPCAGDVRPDHGTN